MKTRFHTAAIVAALMAGCTYAEQNGAAAADEIIVKFASDQTINGTILQAFDDASAETELEKSVQALSDEVGIPFNYSRITSGREIVIEIPSSPVVDKIAQRVGRAEAVDTVVTRTDDVSSAPGELLVTLKRESIESGADVDPNALAAELIDDHRLAVFCELRADGRLAIMPNLERLVGTLAEQLSSRPDIDYAQPNYRVRHFERNQ